LKKRLSQLSRSEGLTVLFDLALVLFGLLWLATFFVGTAGLGPVAAVTLRRVLLFAAIGGWVAFPKLRQNARVFRLLSWMKERVSQPKWSLGIGIALLICGTLLAVILSALQVLGLKYPFSTQLAAHHQLLWNWVHGNGPFTTLDNPHPAGEWFGLALAPWVPIYWLMGGSVLALPIGQSLMIWAGIAAWGWLAYRLRGVVQEVRTQLALATLLFAWFFGHLWSIQRAGFQPYVLAFACLSWAFTLLFTEPPAQGTRAAFARRAGILGLFTLTVISSKLAGLSVAICLLCWSAWEFKLIPRSRWRRQWAWPVTLMFLGLSLGTALLTTIWPEIVLERIWVLPFLRTANAMLLPWLFIPAVLWVSRRRLNIPYPMMWFLAALPPWILGIGLGLDDRWKLLVWPVMAVLTILTLARQRSEKFIWAWPLVGLLIAGQDPWQNLKEYWRATGAERSARLAMISLPTDRTLASDEAAGPWVARRQSLSEWPDMTMFPDRCPDLVLVRRSEGGTITELGVQSVIVRCASGNKRTGFGKYLKMSPSGAPIPLWRAGEWAAYEVVPR